MPEQVRHSMFSRRALVKGAGVIAAGAALGVQASPAAGAARSARRRARLLSTYDQAAFEFAPVTLGGGGPSSRWERQVAAGAPWRDLGVVGSTLTFTPTWRDVGAAYRSVNSLGQPQPATQITAPALTGLDPAAFGAIGDGLADDTAAINAALTQAALQGTGVDLHGRTYAVSSYLFVKHGVTAVFDGTLLQTSTPSTLWFALKSGGTPNVSGCVIYGVSVQIANDRQALGIGGPCASRVAVVACSVTGPASLGTGISLWNDSAGGEDTADIVIRSNTIRLADGDYSPDSGPAIQVSAPLDLQGQPDMIAFWRTYWTGPGVFYSTTNVDVADNDIRGGYYGVSINGVAEYRVEANQMTMNTRNISAQSSSNLGVIRDNHLNECVSSSIHLAYGSSDNEIYDNTIVTSRANGEGLLQAYVGTKRNQFSNNDVLATSATGPKWYIYCGVHADDNVFAGNQLSGTCSRAYIAVEAAWDSTNTHLAHRGTGIPSVDHFASANTLGVEVTDNVVTPSSPVELICLAGIDDAWGSWRLVNCIATGNTVTPSGSVIAPHLYIG